MKLSRRVVNNNKDADVLTTAAEDDYRPPLALLSVVSN